MDYKTGAEILPAAFTDHEVLVLRLRTPTTETKRRRGRWMTDPGMLTEPQIQERIKQVWQKCKNSRRYYSDEVMWWDRCVKPQLQRLLRHETAVKNANWKEMERHLHECMNDILQNQQTPAEKYPNLHKYNAKLIHHHVEYNAASYKMYPKGIED
jgi:hypothetical protein